MCGIQEMTIHTAHWRIQSLSQQLFATPAVHVPPGVSDTLRMKTAALIAVFASLATGVANATPEILVTALHGMQWQVRYDLAAPATESAVRALSR